MNFLKHWFDAFLRTRHTSGHFLRRALLQSVSSGAASQPLPEHLSRDLLRAAKDDLSAVLKRLDSHEDGLSSAEAQRLLEREGPNEVEHEKPLPWWVHLWHCYRNPFNVLLTLLAVVSYVTEDVKGTIVISSMVALSTLLRFVQEGRSNRAAENLKALVSNTATVIRRDLGTEASEGARHSFEIELHSGRPPQREEVRIQSLVPGDHVVLSAGDMIPADCRVMTAKDLFVSQSAMTGESLPVEKFADRRSSGDSALEQSNLLFMGTNVVSGSATAIVVATGNRTYFGTLAMRVTAADRAPTAFQQGVNSVSWLLIRFALVMVWSTASPRATGPRPSCSRCRSPSGSHPRCCR